MGKITSRSQDLLAAIKARRTFPPGGRLQTPRAPATPDAHKQRLRTFSSPPRFMKYVYMYVMYAFMQEGRQAGRYVGR